MSSNLQIKKTCEYCGNAYIARTFVTRYCSHRCNRLHYKQQVRQKKEQVHQAQVSESFDLNQVLASVHQEYFKVSQAAALLTVSRRTLFRLIASKKLKKKKLGGRTVILKEDIKLFFAQQ